MKEKEGQKLQQDREDDIMTDNFKKRRGYWKLKEEN
jgi:hypothetical protein